MSVIPYMTDPLSKHWSQPDHVDWTFTDTHVTMTKRDFDKLKEYSTTNPSGVYEGKMWKRAGPDCWLLCWYMDTADKKKPVTYCEIHFRMILLQNLIDLISPLEKTP